MKIRAVIIFLAALIFLSSCIGVDTEIVINHDGSGTIALEYRISRLLEALGTQDGNERWLTIPVGRADFERSIQRIPGMDLLSFSSKHDGNDLINSVKLGFSNMEALLIFLDASGAKAIYEKNNGSANRLLLYPVKDNYNLNDESSLGDLFSQVSEGYNFKINLNIPADGTLEASLIHSAQMVSSGRNLIFELPVNELLYSENISLDFRW